MLSTLRIIIFFLFYLPFIAIIIGLFKPNLVTFWSKKKSRAMVLLVYGILSIFSFELFVWVYTPTRDFNYKIIPPPDLICNWSGKGKVLSKSRLDTFNISINIKPNGLVDGYIGNSKITSGFIKKGLWIISDYDYTIYSELEGNISDSLKVKRDYIFILIKFSGDIFKGVFHSSNNKVKGVEDLSLSGKLYIKR